MSFCSFVSSSLNRSRSCCLSLFTPKNPTVGPFPGETCRESTSARTRALAQAEGLSFERAQARGLTFGRGAGSLRQGRTRLSEYARNTRSPLSRSRLSEGLSLKRENPSHLSEGLWPKRRLGERMCGYCLESLFENNELVWFGSEYERVRNSVDSLGEVFRVVFQWSRRKPMAPVSGCAWWCPMCITRGIHHKCKHPLNPTRLYVAGRVES
ncbi:hypothetical protein DEO72_LG2g4049 [Vigna unguiculata]|uniref:Uncharacterized protein n=1 Tax=Vigna unguiculata TaxID=3917 RepID=A0A4D6L597_VIGUN|nr:hypothetical protein DEO72_LG2g4049 [Vigna unguiculata]